MRIGKKHALTAIISTIHAFWLLVLSLLLLNWQFVHWDEGELIQFGPILKKLVLGWEQKPAREDLMFVNVSYNNQLVEITDSLGFPLGNERITDRAALEQFVKLLRETNTYRAVLLDIRFDLSSDQDEPLEEALKGTERIIASTHMQNGVPEPSTVQVTTGISDYPIVGGGFFKFRYFYYDSLKTVPVLLQEMMSGKSYEPKGAFFTEGERLYYNIFLTDLLVRPFDLFTAEDHYFYENLGNLLYLDAGSFASISRDKLIVVGDFEKNDIHETLLGDMPGPLILLNAYLTLANGTNALSAVHIIFMFFCYLLLSLIIFVPGDPVEEFLARMSGNNRIASILAGIFSYFLFLIFIVLLSYLLFDVLLNVLWLTFYLYLVDKLVSWGHSRGIRQSKKGEIQPGTPPVSK